MISPARPEPVDLAPLAPLPSAAERAAGAIRDHIFNGRFAPGAALPETQLAQALQVSRNTVRDALRTLTHERLLSFEPHRGVSVRRLTVADVDDIYRLRKVLELAAVDRLADGGDDPPLDGLRRALASAQALARAGDWAGLGTADLRFHAALVALLGSARTDEFFQGLLTELRLGFLAAPDARALHSPYVARNAELLALLERREFTTARTTLDQYLDQARDLITAAVGGTG